MWNYSVDRAAFKFGQLNRGKISSHRCNTEKFDCPGQITQTHHVYKTPGSFRQSRVSERISAKKWCLFYTNYIFLYLYYTDLAMKTLFLPVILNPVD